MGLFLSLLLVVSAFFRGISITSAPPELFGDELDVGYQAYSLLKTGRDLYSQPLPTYIHSLSEWRAPLAIYSTVPSIAAFGLTEIGVRLPVIIFGTIAPVILFLLVFQTTRSKFLSLSAAFALSLSPWHLYYSRSAFEVVIMLDLIMLGTLVFLRQKYSSCAAFFALAIYTYSAAAMFVPLWLAVLFLLTKSRPRLVPSAVFLLMLTPFIFQTVSGNTQNRFGILSIFQSEEVIRKINDLRQPAAASIPERLFHNKLESWGLLFVYNYSRAFSTDFLFVRGDPTARHSIQVVGQLLPVTAPLLILGLYYLARRRLWIWLAWLLLAPVPAALTIDGAFHATRLFLMLPPLAVAIGAGLHVLYEIFINKRTLTLAIYYSLFTINFVWFWHFYTIHYPRLFSRWWHVGYKSAMQGVNRLSPNFSKVFINNSYEPSLIRYLFYSRFPPANFHSLFQSDQEQKDIYPGYDGFRLGDKYYFGTFSKEKEFKPGNLYLVSQRDEVGGDWDWRKSPPGGVEVLTTTVDYRGTPLFYLVTGSP